MSSDYSDEVLGNGLDAGLYGTNTIQEAADAQLSMVEAILDPELSVVALSGVNASGMSFQTAGSVKLASVTGGLAASWATAVITGHDRHHIIPRFLMGRYTWDNRMDLPSDLHRELHDEIRRAFVDVGLDPPDTRGRNVRAYRSGQGTLSWRNKFKNNLVSPADLQRAQNALIAGSRVFDGNNPGYNVAANVSYYMNKASNVSDAGRLARYGGSIR